MTPRKASFRTHFLITTFLSFVYLGTFQEGHGAAYTWISPAGTNWRTNGFWDIPNYPNAVDDKALFTNPAAPSANRSIGLGGVNTVGTLQISNSKNITFTGGGLTFQVSSGNAMVDISGSGTHTVFSPISMLSDVDFTHNSTGTFTINGKITSSNTLTKKGSGFLSLNDNNIGSMTGQFKVDQGTLRVIANSVNSASSINLSGGILQIATGANLSVPISLLSSSTILSEGAITLSGVISGPGGVTYSANLSTRTVTPNQINTYLGDTTLDKIICIISNPSNLGNSGNSLIFSSNGGTLQTSTPYITLTQPIVLSGTGTIHNTSYLQTIELGGLITGPGSLINSQGILNLTNPSANTYSGGTTIHQRVIINNPNQLGTGPIIHYNSLYMHRL